MPKDPKLENELLWIVFQKCFANGCGIARRIGTIGVFIPLSALTNDVASVCVPSTRLVLAMRKRGNKTVPINKRMKNRIIQNVFLTIPDYWFKADYQLP
ncbi:MAG: hypothetical protein JWQ71_4799 [Pedosphaera sp.]|nr:hypothetical protein [Pedosphaera sp.]